MKKIILWISLICLLGLSGCGGREAVTLPYTLPDVGTERRPPETTTALPETTTALPETTTAPRETTTVPPETTTALPETTTAPPETTTAPPETTTALPETTTAPPETTTAPPETTTAPPETTTAPPETTTVLSETTTALPETTTAPPETTMAPPETTAAPPGESGESVPAPAEENGFIVCLDPGHQARANLELEPQAPGSDVMKAKVADGTRGVTTGIRESVVNLTIALKLKAELEERGYRVIMTRETEEVDISNRERAEIANEAGAQAFLRLHCDYSADPNWQGCAIFCQPPTSEYNRDQYEASRRLSDILLESMCSATGAQNRGVTEVYNYTGINWSRVPGGLIEMGFLSNVSDEEKLLDEAYQRRLAEAMADGLDRFFGR